MFSAVASRFASRARFVCLCSITVCWLPCESAVRAGLYRCVVYAKIFRLALCQLATCACLKLAVLCHERRCVIVRFVIVFIC